ncbi:AraC family transcriptional regulator [Sinomicrobium pectinilyticum]|uniref:AraC family transcriptional regulator n=2 Tax=Sinomicrobium pectinilyticum TaxID=1084421 RepID=A0A3N0EPN1_SINP1|nr:AraC family transcriptional regulator [Sinomicrobium pectinilyticum]
MLLFSAFLFSVKGNKRLPNQIFATFLLITAFDLTGLFLIDGSAKYLNFQILKSASSLLQMPAFYLYVLSVCYSDFTLKPKHLLHTGLFFLFLLILKINSYSNQSLLILRIVGEVQYFAYIVAIFFALKKYKTIYLENYSNPDYTNYKWLFQATVIFCIAHVFVLVKLGAHYFHNDQHLLQYIYILISISALSVICWFVLKALYSPYLFTGVRAALKPIKSTTDKYKTTAEKDIASNEAIKRLTFYMENEKPYLDFELTLQKLASQFGMQEKELSILINQYLGKHFFDFINEYRIEEAKRILGNPHNEALTILEILYQVGFNSKSSFYTAFKKETNQTPTSYRKSALSG